MKISKIVVILLFLFFVLSKTACLAYSSIIDKEVCQHFNNDSVIVVKGDKQFVPFEFLNEKGEPDGFSVELFKTLMSKLNIKYTLELDDWDKVQNELFNKKIDMAIGMIYSEERADKVKFGIPHCMITYNIICRKNNDFLRMKDLRGKKIIVQNNDRAHLYLLKTQLTDQIITVNSIDEGIDRLSEGEGDALISYDVTAFYYVRKGHHTDLRVHLTDIEPEKYSMVVNTDNEELLYLLNNALYQMKIDGEYDRLYYKWFGVYEQKQFISHIRYILIIIGIVAALAFIFIWMLKHQVNVATHSLKANNDEMGKLITQLREENQCRIETEKRLIIAKDRAEESDRLKSTFLASMSHEIRTPLNAIVGFSSLLPDVEDMEKRKKFIKIIDVNTNLLLQLINDILDLSMIEAKAMRFTTDQFVLSQLCREALSASENVLREEVKLVEDIQFDCTICSDRSRVLQVLRNLVNNACKFTYKGTIVLGTRKVDENHVSIFVKDSGIGIPEQKIETIFDHFTKLDDFTQGTGLGLAICKLIVENLGGEIKVTSAVGEGSEFLFILPLRYEPNV